MKRESKITYREEVAKNYHDARYYENMAEGIRYYAIRQLDKELLYTSNKTDITKLLDKYKDATFSRSGFNMAKVLEKIYQKNLKAASTFEKDQFNNIIYDMNLCLIL